MKRLFQIEWTKFANYTFVKVILILHFALFLLTVFLFSQIDVSIPGFRFRNLFAFPDVWSSFAWVASWFNLLLAIMVLVLTGNEYSHRTFRQQVVAGMSRNELLYSKWIMMVIVAVYGFLLVILSGAIFGIIFTNDFSFGMLFEKFPLILVYLIQALGYMAIGVFAAVLFRSNALGIIMMLLYFIFIEPIIRGLCPHEIRSYFPVKIISHLTPPPEILSITSERGMAGAANALDFDRIGLIREQLPLGITVVLAIAYIALFSLGTFWLLRKRDL